MNSFIIIFDPFEKKPTFKTISKYIYHSLSIAIIIKLIAETCEKCIEMCTTKQPIQKLLFTMLGQWELCAFYHIVNSLLNYIVFSPRSLYNRYNVVKGNDDSEILLSFFHNSFNNRYNVVTGSTR